MTLQQGNYCWEVASRKMWMGQQCGSQNSAVQPVQPCIVMQHGSTHTSRLTSGLPWLISRQFACQACPPKYLPARAANALQVLADALGDLLQSGSLDDSSRQQLPDQQGGLQHLSPAAAAVLDFVTGLLAAGRVTVAPALMLKVLRHVLGPPTATSTASSGTQGPTAAGKPGSKLYALSGASSSAGAGVGSPSSLASAALTPSAPQERLVLRLLEVVGVVPLSLSQAGGSGRAPGAFPPPASQLQQQQRQNEAHQLQPSTERLDGADFEAALALCYEHGMLLAAGRLLHLRRDVGAALATYLEVPAPEPAFAYIHT
jgi:hypothetical protein